MCNILLISKFNISCSIELAPAVTRRTKTPAPAVTRRKAARSNIEKKSHDAI